MQTTRILQHFRNGGTFTGGRIQRLENSSNRVARAAKEEFVDVVRLDGTRFDQNDNPGQVSAQVAGQVGSHVAHRVEAEFQGDLDRGRLSTVKTFAEGEPDEHRIYTETLISGGRIACLEYNERDQTALLRTVESKRFGLTEVLTLQELEPRHFEQWEIAEAVHNSYCKS